MGIVFSTMSDAADYDIFISYTHDDAEVAKRLADQLVGCGWSVFWDRVLLPGATWRTQIQTALSAAKVVVVMWSDKAVASRWVEIEADFAFQRDAYLPVKIDGCSLPLGLSHVQVADLRHWHAGTAPMLPDVLLAALKHRLGTPAAARQPTALASTGPIATDAAAINSNPAILLRGSAYSGENYELTVSLRQLYSKLDGLIIGRTSPQSDLTLAHPSVSRRHAVLLAADGRLVIYDAGSTNGTYVNDQEATRAHPAALARGSIIRLGDIDLVVESIPY